MNPSLGASICHQSPADALAGLDCSSEGLSDEEVRRRLATFGPNQVAAVARESL